MSSGELDGLLTAAPERFHRLMAVVGLASVGEFAAALAHFAADAQEDNFGLLEEGLRVFITELKASHEERDRVHAALLQANQEIEQKLALIESQRHEIHQLSAPILDVWDGVLAVPLVGTLDHLRALAVTDALLQRVVATRSRAALVDLTGVDGVDADTADHLIQLVRAVKLVGCRAVITGVSPGVARTLAALEHSPRDLQCLPNLREGLRHCLLARSAASSPATSRP
ncbi:STAS domain-containing protein [Nannocystis sp. ILAH1]|uniref:STAS domain-containing protein n=1 Tax=unclassified Nannocystis TaxID=2627009 RepID=UPI002271DB3B|nr:MULTISPECIES: STAS domain-containing protein [unclassified Nannocystis]MCY0994555.1 STAS domain-containing protein [Nannocystis sp. ILAH1]MCY1063177.1 STAS domain-containing protein [Nannocystis sp. RBIL2]